MAAFNAADAGRVVALFADDATVEDPVGSPVVAGREAILAFYRHATSLGARLDLVAAGGAPGFARQRRSLELRGVCANAGALRRLYGE